MPQDTGHPFLIAVNFMKCYSCKEMRITFDINYWAGEDGLEPKFVCPVCKQTGLAFDPKENGYNSFTQRCLCCGYLDNPNYGPGREKNWHDSWIECGSVKLYEKPYEERREIFSKIMYAYTAKYRYVLSDEEIAKREFDDRLFTQYGFADNSDSTRKVCVRCEDGKTWQFAYKTNTIFYLDDETKFFAVGENPDTSRYFLFPGEYLTQKSSGEKRYRGFYTGFVPDLFGGYYDLNDECVLTGLDEKKYNFKIETTADK